MLQKLNCLNNQSRQNHVGKRCILQKLNNEIKLCRENMYITKVEMLEELVK